MEVGTIRTTWHGDQVQFTARIDGYPGASRPEELWFRVPIDLADEHVGAADAFLAALLPIALLTGADLRVADPVSAYLLEGCPQVMQLFQAWFGMRAVRIEATPRETAHDTTPAAGSGCCFTAGVDSFYSLLKRARWPQQRPTHLIYMRGFDIPLANQSLYDRVVERLQAIADSFGARLILGGSNIRHFTNGTARWGAHQHGACLGATALLLKQSLGQFVIPASHEYSRQLPRGSHALLDPLWSTESQEVIHDGCEATRAQKVSREIARSPLALSHLRVCWRNPNDDYNCGRCEKCLRTMINLRLCGALGRCATLPHHLDLDAVRRMVLTNASVAAFSRENMDEALRIGDAPLAAALQSTIEAFDKRRRTLRGLIRRIDQEVLGGSAIAALWRWRQHTARRQGRA